jgi:hypothetical protein
MLEERYVYVPPVENQDKLRTKSVKGASIVSYASRQLLGNDLKEPFPDKAYSTVIETVFMRKWGMLKRGRPMPFKSLQILIFAKPGTPSQK